MLDKFINKIHCGKCEDLIPKLPNNSIDLLITSPPYNVDLGNNKYNDNSYDMYKDNKDHLEYIKWIKDILKAVKSKMVLGGRVCINVGDGCNGSVPTHSDIIQFMTKELKYLIKTVVIWDKMEISNRCAWGSFQSPSNPSFPTPFEYILIFCKDSYAKSGKKEDITVTKKQFINNSLALWKFRPEQEAKKLGHPAPFPLELPLRLIQQLSYKNDVVLDIFSGSGTTCLAAAILGRRWIGFEMSANYVGRSTRRLNRYLDQKRLIF